MEFQLQHQSFQCIFRTDFLQDWQVGSPWSPRDSQESSPIPQFKSISSSALSFPYSPTLTSIHDHWKTHSLDQTLVLLIYFLYLYNISLHRFEFLSVVIFLFSEIFPFIFLVVLFWCDQFFYLLYAFVHARSVASFIFDSYNTMDCSPPGSSVHGILYARILEWVAMPSSRGSSTPRDRIHISYVSCIVK